jgi:hypothetical protein
MNTLFHSAPIDASAWIKIIGIGLVVFLIVETKKAFAASRRVKASG